MSGIEGMGGQSETVGAKNFGRKSCRRGGSISIISGRSYDTLIQSGP